MMEYLQNDISTFPHFSAYHGNSVACTKIKEFQLEDFSTRRKLSIIALMGKSQTNDSHKYDFKYRDMCKRISVFGLVELTGCQCKDQVPGVSPLNSCAQVESCRLSP